jgi:hypothetical protein
MEEKKQFIRWSRIALVACLTAVICDLVSLGVFARFYPAYNSRFRPISGLGASDSPVAHIVSGWWIFMGLIFLLFSYAYGRSNFDHHPAKKVTAWLIGVYALGEEAGSGLFPGNHIAGHLTTSGIIHNVIGGIGVIAIMAIPFVLMKKYNRINNAALYWFLLLVSLTGIIFFLLFSLSRFTLPGINGVWLWHGFWQRLFVANYYFMLIAVAAKQVMESRAQ